MMERRKNRHYESERPSGSPISHQRGREQVQHGGMTTELVREYQCNTVSCSFAFH